MHLFTKKLRRLAVGMVVTGVASTAALIGVNPSPATAATAYPSSIDALGDSMTKAFNTNCPFAWTDCPTNSWATGTDTTVNSMYLRLKALNPEIQGRAYNDAVSGAKMSDLPRQAWSAVGRGVQAVTVLMGNNDACGGSSGTMTSVDSYRADFTTAMDTLTTGLPDAQIRVSSLPDAYQLWELYHTDSNAVAAWQTFGMCNALLLNPTSTEPADVARRAAFRQREIDYNTALAQVCAEYSQCTFDGNVGFNTTFQKEHVSTNDYFHPSLAGQALIASTGWRAIGW